MKSLILGLFMFALCAFSTHVSAVDFLKIKGTFSAEGSALAQKSTFMLATNCHKVSN